ncbi:DICT domain protein [Natrialba magadii ATCC 43099]|uniref:DICT domain protein n=1 Tax=Natrialba magadii (strain ATCC 43099 / DSM 3394 / CCM 3739 / CIP 104546 / IAM 13178 / JCM 8861 / NBRC 102185 / NCIMB 2190 / MS3) TaxID=547559 RepID=D3SVD1_NATMM|nr:DICT sensory domain-containing protein [Natrialba magadii]ADD05539.1 DICT domain protein [Natrialba magadii ATCC 43099]ELY29499.1 sensor protein [Natrialba magadii ATCC 43099]
MTISGLEEALEIVENERKHLAVYTAETDVAAELQQQFTTRNVTVEHRQAAAFDDGFVVIRGADGSFRGALGIEYFGAILSPDSYPPWTLENSGIETRQVFDFLENTLFSSYDRRQLLAVSREIEERAWRLGEGALYAGFERKAAFEKQREVYDRLSSRGALSVTVFLDAAWDAPTEGLAVVSALGEIGQFWFVVFDGAGNTQQACALVAEERQPGRYYGFWTYDPELVGELVACLEDIDGVQSA